VGRGPALVAAIVVAASSCAVAAAANARDDAAPVRLTAAVVFDDGHCGSVALVPFVFADLPAGTTEAQAPAIERRLRPASTVTLVVNARSYSLTRLRANDSLSSLRIVWGFRAPRVSKAAGLAMLGKAATVDYVTASGAKQTLRTRVKVAPCG
jgi:hypothetical protein